MNVHLFWGPYKSAPIAADRRYGGRDVLIEKLEKITIQNVSLASATIFPCKLAAYINIINDIKFLLYV